MDFRYYGGADDSTIEIALHREDIENLIEEDVVIENHKEMTGNKISIEVETDIPIDIVKEPDEDGDIYGDALDALQVMYYAWQEEFHNDVNMQYTTEEDIEKAMNTYRYYDKIRRQMQ